MPGVAWRRRAVSVLVFVNLGVIMLFPSDQITHVVRLVVIVVLFAGAWYGDRRARRAHEKTEHTA
jgi:predicted membrane channel-forming protein YqfA (hemolysin III family)